jgi:hypothetical protein
MGQGYLSVVLPYFAFAAAKSNDTLHLRQFVDLQGGFEWTLARAVFAGLSSQKDDATKLLDSAFHDWAVAHGDQFPISAYHYIATCILLYEDTHDDAYRQAALRLARPFRRFEPAFAFGHAAVGFLSDEETERVPALAIALYLDPRSEWASKAPAASQAAARTWFDKHPNPFTAKDQDWSWYAEQ